MIGPDGYSPSLDQIAELLRQMAIEEQHRKLTGHGCTVATMRRGRAVRPPAIDPRPPAPAMDEAMDEATAQQSGVGQARSARVVEICALDSSVRCTGHLSAILSKAVRWSSSRSPVTVIRRWK